MVDTSTERWILSGTPEALRLEANKIRSLDSRAFTWAHLLYGELHEIGVYVLYLPLQSKNSCDAEMRKFIMLSTRCAQFEGEESLSQMAHAELFPHPGTIVGWLAAVSATARLGIFELLQ